MADKPNGSGLISQDWFLWLTILKQRVEDLPGEVAAENIIGPLQPDQIPQLPSSRLTFTNSPRLLGRTTAGSGPSEEIQVAGGLQLTGGVLSALLVPGGYTIGDLFYANTINSIARLADVSVGSYLRSGGVGVAPLWSTLKLPNTATTGDLPYASASNVYSNLADVSVGSYLRSGGLTTAPLWSTLKLPNAATTGDVLYASSANTIGNLADVAAGSYLRSGGVTTAPLWSTVVIPNTAVTGDLWYASAANTVIARTIGSTNDVLTVSGGIPVWAPSVAASVTITDDTTTNATMFPTWVTANTGNLPLKVTSTKLSFNPSLGHLFVGTPTTASGLTGGGVNVYGATGENAVLALFLNTNQIGYFRANGTSMDCRAVAGQLLLSTQSSSTIILRPNTTEVMRVAPGGVSLALATPTAILHLKAGTTAASTAPLKFNSGSLLTTAEAGAVEFLTDGYYATITTGAARKGIVLDDGTALTSGRVPFATTNGRLTDDADLTFATDTLTTTKLVITNKLTSYNAVATAGWGAPAIQASARSTAQVAAVASVAAYTCGAADGSFVVSTNVNVTTSTAHNFTVAVDYTDETNTARTLTLPVVQLAGTVITAITNVTGAGPYEGIATQIRCKASTAITIKTVGTFTTVTYNVEGLIQQVA